jgi:uncharacterized RDD family membrane protein YckC
VSDVREETLAPPLPTPLVRAGFWRRLWAFVVDALLICVPLQIAVGALYPITNGKVQFNGGLAFNTCNSNVAVDKLPPAANPPSMHANAASICRSTFFGLETARWLTVSRVTQEGALTKTFSLYYRLDRNNMLANVYVVDWVALVGILIFLVTLEHRFGTTPGKRLLGLRVADLQEDHGGGIALRAAALRNILLWIGTYPMIIVAAGIYAAGAWNAEGFMSSGVYWSFTGAGLLGFAISLWIVIVIARKRDPVYDRFARTAVVRLNPAVSPAGAEP